MGATSWRYDTPHHPDPAAALRALRADVFARGDYVDLTGSLADRLRETARRFGRDPDPTGTPSSAARGTDGSRA